MRCAVAVVAAVATTTACGCRGGRPGGHGDKHPPDQRGQHRRRKPKPQPTRRGPKPSGGAHEQPGSNDPKPGPRVDHPAPPMRAQFGEPPQSPLRREHKGPRADRAGDEAHDCPDPEVTGQTHRQGQQHGQGEPHAHHPRRFDAQRSAGYRTGKVAGVVARRKPAAVTDVESAAVQHQRQKRRKGKAANTERHRQHDHAGDCSLAGRVRSGRRGEWVS